MGDAAVSDDAGPGPEERIRDAALSGIARWGVAKTTFDDVARLAGCSRATVYRLFPGGKDTLVEAVVAAEVDELLTGIRRRLEATGSLEDRLVESLAFAARRLQHHEALQYVLAHEPELVLPHVAFAGFDEVLASVAAVVAPPLTAELGEDLATRTAEWLARVVVSYAFTPGPSFDLSDEAAAARFIDLFVLPGLRSARPVPA